MRRLLGVLVTAALLTTLAITGEGVAFANDTNCAQAQARVASDHSAVSNALAALPLVQSLVDSLNATLTADQHAADVACHDGGGDHNGDHGGINCPHSINCGGGGPIPAGNFRDRFDGRHVIVLDGGTNVDACDGSGSYDVFLSRHAQYRDRISRVFPDSDWNASRASCTTTETDGNCVTVTTTYNNALDSVRRWNDAVGRDRNLRFNRTSPQWRELDQAYQNKSRYTRDFYIQRPTVNTTCTVPATLPVQVAAPPATYVAPSSAPQVSQVPSGSINTGGWSALFTLAHNRAV
jgi:hypothetical protein